MKMTFLGTGSAYGVPTNGGDWGVCDPKNPRNRRLCQSVLLETADTKVLVDVGPSFREQTITHKIRGVDAVWLTHAHYDHIGGIPELSNFIKWQRHDLPIYASEETMTGVKKCFYYLFDDDIKVKHYGENRLNWKTLSYLEPVQINDIELLPLQLFHGVMDATGFKVNNSAYCTDLQSMPDESWERLENLDTLVLECNSRDKRDDKHNYVSQAIAWHEALKPRETWLTHFDITMDDMIIGQNLPTGMKMAYDGLTLNL